jgi:predicted nucleotide-binding protein
MNSSDLEFLVPDPDDLLARSVEEKAMLIFELLAREHTSRDHPVSHSNFFNRAADEQFPPKYGTRPREVDESLMEPWGWLENRGFLVKSPSTAGNWYFVGNSGKEAVEKSKQAAEKEALFERLEALGFDRVKSDLTHNEGRRTAHHGKELDAAWEWVRMKENQSKPPVQSGEPKALSRKVFVVHGHDEAAREKIARFLERLDFTPIILHEQASRGRTVIEKVEAHSDVGFAVVLLTPDDEGCEKGGTPRPRARQNVVLELGYFLGRLGRDYVCPLKRGEIEIPSDFEGVVYIPFDNSGGWKQALGRELEDAGFKIDWAKAMGVPA